MVILLLGAGFSKAIYGVPLMTELYKSFSKYLEKKEKQSEKTTYEDMVKILEKKYKEIGTKLDIEAILTVLDDLSNPNPFNALMHPTLLYLFEENKIPLNGILSNRYSEEEIEVFTNIKKNFTEYIIEECDVRDKKGNVNVLDEFFDLIIGGNFKKRIKQRREKIEKKELNINQDLRIFTTNYDTCLEKYFGEGKIGYETGITFTPDKKKMVVIRKMDDNALYNFNPLSPRMKIFKLHGSITWRKMGNGTFQEIDPKFPKEKLTVHGESIEDILMVYPIIGKERFREPFSDAFEYFRKCILDEEILIVIGYSWRDDEIKDLIIDAVKRKREQGGTSKVILIGPSANAQESMLNIKSIPINQNFNRSIIDKLNGAMQKK